jgi:hypothetical protein
MKMKTFENLKFNQKRNYNGQFTSGKRAYLRIDRHFAVSVLFGGEDCYTNGIDTYEMAILYNDEVLFDNGQQDVYAYISKEKVNEVLIHLQSLTETEIALFRQQYREKKKFRREYQKIMNERYDFLQSIGIV